MSDILERILAGATAYMRRLKDMGDGTHAEVVSVGEMPSIEVEFPDSQTVDDGGSSLTVDGTVGISPDQEINVARWPNLVKSIRVSLALAVGAHSASDVLGGRLEFPDASLASGGGGSLSNVVIVDDAGQDKELELWLFNSQPTAIDDDDAFAPAEDDLHSLAGVFSTTKGSWMKAGTPSVCALGAVGGVVHYDLDPGTSLWGYLVCREEYTPAAADDITVIITPQRT